MKYWWVNQNQTYKFEVPGGFLWSPKTKSNGDRNRFYDSMTELSVGDVIFSFADTLIKAAGVVQSQAYESPKPDFRTAGSNWADIGWFAEVEFIPIDQPIAPKDHMELIGPLLSDIYAPLQLNGRGNQGVYLTEISYDLGNLLTKLSHLSMDFLWTAAGPNLPDDSLVNSESVSEVENALEKLQLVKARRGQGLFKANVRLIEKACRVTGLTTPRHLIASHIKPWSISNNTEKLDGSNGLLLSPHVDHLFDKGFISFENAGDIKVSRELDPQVLKRWSIDIKSNVSHFDSRQSEYLEYHRKEVFIA